MSLKTRLDKLSPKIGEVERLQQAHFYWKLKHVVQRDALESVRLPFSQLSPPPQAFLDSHIYDPRSHEQRLADIRCKGEASVR
jgi:hypothetical protein